MSSRPKRSVAKPVSYNVDALLEEELRREPSPPRPIVARSYGKGLDKFSSSSSASVSGGASSKKQTTLISSGKASASLKALFAKQAEENRPARPKRECSSVSVKRKSTSSSSRRRELKPESSGSRRSSRSVVSERKSYREASSDEEEEEDVDDDDDEDSSDVDDEDEESAEDDFADIEEEEEEEEGRRPRRTCVTEQAKASRRAAAKAEKLQAAAKNNKKGKSSKKKEQKRVPVMPDKQNNEDDIEEVDEDDDDSLAGADAISYRIQHILTSKAMTPEQWRAVCSPMTTREITRGSVWKQPDEEFFDTSKEPLEKFLIKWLHASYLHVSWETEKDLLELAGPATKSQIKKFRLRCEQGEELFEDLNYRLGEYFPPSFTVVERVLDVDEDTARIVQTVDWRTATLPSSMNTAAPVSHSVLAEISPTAAATAAPMAVLSLSDGQNQDDDCELTADKAKAVEVDTNGDNDDGDVAILSNSRASSRVRSTRTIQDSDDDDDVNREDASAKSNKKQPVRSSSNNNTLHGEVCWLVVKWENLPYSDNSFEDVNDLFRCGIEYEAPLRQYYQREQSFQDPIPGPIKGGRSSAFSVEMMNSSDAPDTLRGGTDKSMTLRDYQWEGVRWLLFNWTQKRSSILADEMGLGKTIQTATFLQALKQHGCVRGPILIVAPLSTVVNWQRELLSWTDMNIVVYHGSQEDREFIREYEFRYSAGATGGAKGRAASDRVKADIVVTTPETCIAYDSNAGNSTARELSRIRWDAIVVDEAHKLKNYESKITAVLRDEYQYSHSLLLTGTPLQNNTDELWALLNFVAREEFADRASFMEQFGELTSATQLQALHEKLKPFLLRREKELVEKSVPSKEEIIVEVELTVPQKQYYRAIYEQKTGFLYKSGAKDGPSLTNLAMELRKCCNHPFLIKGAETELSKHFEGEDPLAIMMKTSGKLLLLDKLLTKLKADGHRVLIFSQFRIMLNILEDYLLLKQFSFDRIDGAITGRKRQAAIDRYSSSDAVFAMLLSTKAGGVGINLTAADTVIIFDSDWNPQNDLQAQARAHRIGQKKNVKVYRLLTKKTYEAVMFQTASIKLGLDYAVMHNMHHTAEDKRRVANSGGGGGAAAASLEGISADKGAEHVSALSKKELETLLKHGAYGLFREDQMGMAEQESKKFFEESIDEILQHSAVVVTHDDKCNQKKRSAEADGSSAESADGSATADASTTAPAQKSSSFSFSKASFVSSGSGQDDVAIDDPEFWAKVVGLPEEQEDSDDAMFNARGRRGRKCRSAVSTYNEAAILSGRAMMGGEGDSSGGGSDDSSEESSSGWDDSDSCDSSCEAPARLRRKQRRLAVIQQQRARNEELVRIPAEFNQENLTAIMLAMFDVGYGKWQAVRSISKLNWHTADVAYACSICLLLLIHKCSMSLPPTGNSASSEGGSAASTTAATTVTTTAAVRNGDDDNVEQQREEQPFVEALLRRTKAGAVAMAACTLRRARCRDALDAAVPTSSASTNATIASTSSVGAALKDTTKVLENALLSQKLLTAATSSTDTAPTVNLPLFVKMSEVSAESTVKDLLITAITLQQEKNVEETGIEGSKDMEMEMDGERESAATAAVHCVASAVTSLACASSSQDAIDILRSVTRSHLNALPVCLSSGRGALRQKLAQIDDMFELFLAAKYGTSRYEDSVRPATTTETNENAAANVASESTEDGSGATENIVLVKTSVDTAADANVGTGADTENSPDEPVVTIEKVDFSVLQPFLEQHDTLSAATATGSGYLPGVWSVKHDCVLLCAITKLGWPSKKRTAAKMEQFFAAEELFFFPASSSSAPSSAPGPAPNKFLTRRAKELANILRSAASVVRQSAKAAQKDKAAERDKAQKLVNAVMRALRKAGRPHEVYSIIRDKLVSLQQKQQQQQLSSVGMKRPRGDSGSGSSMTEGNNNTGDCDGDGDSEEMLARRCACLLTWEQFLSECTAGTAAVVAAMATMESVKSIVGTIVAAYDVPKEQASAEGAVCTVSVATNSANSPNEEDSGTAATEVSIPMKQVLACKEREPVIHKLRLLLSTASQSQLEMRVLRFCKVAGHRSTVVTVASGRDSNMPVWWSPAHDANLLRAALDNGGAGGANLFKILVAEHAGLVNPPADFELPPVTGGVAASSSEAVSSDSASTTTSLVTALTSAAMSHRLSHLLKSIPVEDMSPVLPASVASPVSSRKSKNSQMFAFTSSLSLPGSGSEGAESGGLMSPVSLALHNACSALTEKPASEKGPSAASERAAAKKAEKAAERAEKAAAAAAERAKKPLPTYGATPAWAKAVVATSTALKSSSSSSALASSSEGGVTATSTSACGEVSGKPNESTSSVVLLTAGAAAAAVAPRPTTGSKTGKSKQPPVVQKNNLFSFIAKKPKTETITADSPVTDVVVINEDEENTATATATASSTDEVPLVIDITSSSIDDGAVKSAITNCDGDSSRAAAPILLPTAAAQGANRAFLAAATVGTIDTSATTVLAGVPAKQMARPTSSFTPPTAKQQTAKYAPTTATAAVASSSSLAPLSFSSSGINNNVSNSMSTGGESDFVVTLGSPCGITDKLSPSHAAAAATTSATTTAVVVEERNSCGQKRPQSLIAEGDMLLISGEGVTASIDSSNKKQQVDGSSSSSNNNNSSSNGIVSSTTTTKKKAPSSSSSSAQGKGIMSFFKKTIV